MRPLYICADLAFIKTFKAFLLKLRKKILKAIYMSNKQKNLDDFEYIEALYIIILKNK